MCCGLGSKSDKTQICNISVINSYLSRLIKCYDQ